MWPLLCPNTEIEIQALIYWDMHEDGWFKADNRLFALSLVALNPPPRRPHAEFNLVRPSFSDQEWSSRRKDANSHQTTITHQESAKELPTPRVIFQQANRR